MQFDPNSNRYTLSTGRTVYANNGILGLSPSGDGYEGYDGDLRISVCDIDDDDDDWEPNFTLGEREEIATEMVRRWIQWSTRVKEEPPRE